MAFLCIPNYRTNWASPSASLAGGVIQIDNLGSPSGEVAPTRAPLRLSPAQAAAALTELVLGDEGGEERALFLSRVEGSAREYGVRGSTLGGSASIDTLVGQLLSGFDPDDKVLASHQATCRDWVLSLR